MVDLSDPKSHEKFSVDVKLLLIPGALLFLLVVFFIYRLLKTNRDRVKAKQEKKKMKEEKKKQ